MYWTTGFPKTTFTSMHDAGPGYSFLLWIAVVHTDFMLASVGFSRRCTHESNKVNPYIFRASATNLVEIGKGIR